VTIYLADSSIWVGRRRTDAGELSSLFVDRLRRSEIATCVPVAIEVLSGPADGEAYVRDWTRLWSQLHWLPLRERATGRALEVQSELALSAPGAHRRSLSHFLIAACAEDAGSGVVLWHWDLDLAAICEHTGQPYELVQSSAALPAVSTTAELSAELSTPTAGAELGVASAAELSGTAAGGGNGSPRPALNRPPWEDGARA
jgi:predicted nucleic acid-binding protein